MNVFLPKRTLKYYYLKLIRLRGEPNYLARGVAIGTFVGITPTIPFHTVLALSCALLFRGSRIAALLATILVSNPITFFPQYYFSWKIGNLMTTVDHSWEEVSSLFEAIVNGHDLSATLAALGKIGINSILILVGGGIILAIPFTIVFYIGSHLLFKSIQKKRLEKKKLL